MLARAWTEIRGSRQWEAMARIGEAWREMSVTTGKAVFASRSREVYLTLLFSAREQGALDGVLLAVDGFAALGDPELVTHALRMADRLADLAGGPWARRRVQAARTRVRGLGASSESIGA